MLPTFFRTIQLNHFIVMDTYVAVGSEVDVLTKFQNIYKNLNEVLPLIDNYGVLKKPAKCVSNSRTKGS